MKKIFTIAAFFIFAGKGISQGSTTNTGTLYISSGTTLRCTGALTNKDGATLESPGLLEIEGDYINEASAVFSASSGTVAMRGTAGQNLNSGGDDFYNLTVNNSGAGVSLLGNNVTVTNVLTMVDGDIDLNGLNISLSTAGSLSGESNSNRVKGATGEISCTRTLSASTVYNDIAGLGVTITTGVTAPDATVIDRGHTAQTGIGNYGILRYFDISPTTNSSLDATLRIEYYDNELNGQDETDFAFWKSPTGADPWTLRPLSVVTPASNYVEESSIQDFSRWTISNKTANPLPIELLFFKARWKDQHYTGALLEWKTTSEINNDYFEIQRSTDAINFEPIGTKQGAGNSSTIINYEFTDVELPLTTTAGAFYYRIKQVDYDGLYTYSHIETLSPQEGINLITVYPNPSSGYIDYLVYSSEDTEVSVWAIDASGKLVVSDKQEIKKGANKQRISTSHLSSGSYILQVTTGENTKTEKQFVLK